MNLKLALKSINFKNDRWAYLILAIICIIFLSSSLFISTHLKRAIIPDEPVHFLVSKHFSSTWGIPEEKYEIYANGIYIQGRPFLYYWINGRILGFLKLIIPSVSDWRQLVALRMVNSFYSMGTVIFCFLLSYEVFKNRYWSLLPSFMLSTTLMFGFLSGGVNYDNLANLFSIISIYYLVRVLQKRDFLINSLGWLAFIMLGTLTKYTILPLALILVIIWIFFIIKNHSELSIKFKTNFNSILLLILMIVSLIPNFMIYGINILKYQSLTKPCRIFLTEEQCNLSPFRARKLAMAPEEKLSLRQVITEGYPDPVRYFLDRWLPRMRSDIFGIFGHRVYRIDPLLMSAFRILFIIVLFFFIRNIDHLGFLKWSLLTIALFYSLIIFHRNYRTELIYAFNFGGIQGRYIFPVISIPLILYTTSIKRIKNENIQVLLIITTVFLFIFDSPLVFLLFSSNMNSLNWFA